MQEKLELPDKEICLILMRHAKAEAQSNDGTDKSRPLSQKGHVQAKKVAMAMSNAGITLDKSIVSTAMRTQQTWQNVQGVFQKAQSISLEALYHAPAGLIWRCCMQHADNASVLMAVGHNPGMAELAAHLLGDKYITFPTSTAAVFNVGPEGVKPIAIYNK